MSQNKKKHLHQLNSFLKTYCQNDKPLLLALSGGPDSMALFHLLLEARVQFAVAHIDHGWRQESAQEAVALRELTAGYGVRFHLKTLNPTTLVGNLEEACRKERYQFFHEVVTNFEYQGVLVAQHADDHAETVLKRLFESASLVCLAGIQPEVTHGKLKVWRPLLKLTKKELLAYLDARGLAFFTDQTNFDPKFGRAKMRTHLLPYLNREFGKEITKSLCRLSEDAEELRQHFSASLTPLVNTVKQGWLGSLLDLSDGDTLSDLELRHLVRMLCESHQVKVQRPLLDRVVLLYKQNATDRFVENGQVKIYVDRKKIFIFLKPQNHFFDKLRILEGYAQLGDFSVEVEAISQINQPHASATDWRAAWMGRMEVVLPVDEYQLEMTTSHALYPDTNPISKWWTSHKVPAILRKWIPVIKLKRNRSIVHEFLTGKRTVSLGNGPWLKICLTFSVKKNEAKK